MSYKDIIKPIEFDYSLKYQDKIFRTNEGYDIKIIKYHSYNDVDIQFLYNGAIVEHVRVGSILDGRVKNPFRRKKNGGYMGIGPYDDSTSRIYGVWDKMLNRLMKDFQESNRKVSSYSNCTVCEEWYNYQNFAFWYDNYIKGLNQNLYYDYEIDKDILQQGKDHKIYSPTTCCLVPHDINVALVDTSVDNGLPTGVFTRGNKFGSMVNLNGERVYLGLYDTPEEAFKVYKERKEKHIKDLAKYYYSINAIYKDIFDILMNYEVK